MPFCYYKSIVLGILFSSLLHAQTRLSDHYRAQAETLATQEKYQKAIALYQKAYFLALGHDAYRAANLCNDLSSAFFAIRKPKKSLEYCYQGLALLKQHSNNPPDSLRFKLYSSLGMMFKVLEAPDSSFHYFQKAQKVLDDSLSVENQIPAYVIHHYNNQAQLYFDKHRYQQSMVYLQKARGLIEKYGLPDELLYVDSSIAECYDLLNDHTLALHYRKAAYARSLKMNTRLKDSFCGAIGWTYQQRNQIDSALIWYQRANTPPQLPSYNSDYARLMWLMASCYREKGSFLQANKYLVRSESFLKKSAPNYRWLMANLLIERGKIAVQQGRYSQCQHFSDKAFRLVSLSESSLDILPIDLIHPQTAISALQLQAVALAKKYRQTQNFSDLQIAFEAFDRVITLQNAAFSEIIEDAEERYTLTKERSYLFEEAFPIGYALYQKQNSASILNRIFSWFEASQSNYLQKLIKNRILKHREWTPALLARERTIIQKRVFLIHNSQKNASLVRDQYNELRIQWYRLQQDVDKIHINQHSPHDSFISLSDIQQKLSPHSAFFSYQWHQDSIYALIITRESATLQRWVVKKKELQLNLVHIRQQLYNNPGLGQYTAALSAIKCYRQLIEPIKKWVGTKKNWIVSRDWQFNFLPFEILETGRFKEDYLIKHVSISYAFSASLFWNHTATSSFSDQDTQKQLMVFAPFVKEITQNKTQKWLPVESLRNLQGMEGETNWGDNATKQQFIKANFNRTILYLATHAESNDYRPEESFIQFYPSQDSRLYLDEIGLLPLHQTRLTILGACKTGEGKNMWGEGNISIAKAFIEAGCPSVVSTTWEANEKTTSILVSLLYKHLREGIPTDLALQKARLSMLNDKSLSEFKHPYYWSNLLLLGNPIPIYDSDISIHHWYIVGILLLGIVGWIALRRCL